VGALAWMLSGCASWYGLRELDAVPADFPLTLGGEVGQVTVPEHGGQIAVDLAFDTAPEARAAWEALRAQAHDRGFAEVSTGTVGRRERAVLEGPEGRLELGCCPQRADRAYLVFVSWWRPTTP
jgi:hypothetical protein